jgi:hypothetical protein
MINTIYLDMDGVFCDFDSRWHEVFGRSPKESRANKEFSTDWDSFIQTNQFASLPWHKTGKQLFEYVLALPSTIRIEMLTSSGGKKYHAEVAAQKTIWLCNNGFPWKANVVAGRALKKDYATPNSILIDDTFDVIEAFDAANGHGIWHKDINVTLQKLDNLLSN